MHPALRLRTSLPKLPMTAPDAPIPTMYTAQRERFLADLRERNLCAVIFTNTSKTRNHDCEYRFRPDSDFWYLTGFREPGSVLVLLPGREEGESILFLRPRVPAEETWTGLRLGVERAPEVVGVDEARPLEELWPALGKLLRGYKGVVYRTGSEPERDGMMLRALGQLRASVRGGVTAPEAVIDPATILHERRLIKSPAEVDVIRRAAAVTARAHTACMALARTAENESDLDACLISHFLGSRGAEAYNNIVAGGANACILHYNDNDAPLRKGDLVLIDAGCELEHYASDVTRTFPVSGTFSPEQKAIYQLVLDAEKQAIEAVKPGTGFLDPHVISIGVLSRGLVELGLLKGSVDEVIESESYTRFFMHKTGHWLGLDVHDCGTYAKDGAPRPFEPGMITTVEPGLYISPDDESVEARWRGIGVRIEDDILVTADGNENLTANIPKEVAEVEAAVLGEPGAART